MHSSLNITRCYAEAFKIYRRHWAGLLGIAAVLFALPLAALTVVRLFRPDDNAIVAVLLLVYLFFTVTGSFWYRALATHLVWSVRKGEDVPVREVVKRAFRGFPRVSTVGFLAWMGTVGGLLLFVVPGLIFGARRSPAMSVAVVEEKGAFYGRRFRDPERSALRRSRDLVKGTGNSFEVFAVIAGKQVLYWTIVAFVPFVPVLGVLAIPWGALATSIVYFELVEIERLGPVQPTGPSSGQSPRFPAQAPLPQAHDSHWRPRPVQGSAPGG